MNIRGGIFTFWWVVDHESDQRHATTTDPTRLDDGTKVAQLCGGQIALAKPGTRSKPESLGIETFCGQCLWQSTVDSHGYERVDVFHF